MYLARNSVAAVYTCVGLGILLWLLGTLVLPLNDLYERSSSELLSYSFTVGF